jgi:transaldolase/glucose-6-phosphate isomerase
MTDNPLRTLAELGQSVWLDYLDRGRVLSGEVRRFIDEDGLRGMTSNPTIFEKAITGDRAYAEPIDALARGGKTAAEILDIITIEDIQLAADEFRATFDRLDRRDGFVSLEVGPQLANDTRGTIDEARRLWRAVGRPNVMIKVPGTAAGVPAIETLVGDGININVTLLFGLDRYDEVAAAYIAGIRSRAALGRPVGVASVASFFLSRIDVIVDAELDARAKDGRIDRAVAARLRGKTAIASAKLAYERYKRHFDAGFAATGARPQRLLWASTSTKDPTYDDVYYVNALIGADTIDTVPIATFDAFRDHGDPEARLERDLDQARAVHRELAANGIDLDAVTHQLEVDGARKFTESWDRLRATIERRRAAATTEQHAPR